MRISDLVMFSNDRFFNGAVQTEWYYDQLRVGKIAASYVFHGPKYYGVSQADVTSSKHKLIDTASFTLKIAQKLNDSKPDNPFVMTIAGYGSGKSHLAVSLGALFSGDKHLSSLVLSNLKNADEDIAVSVERVNTKKNLVLVLNGMNNFNLDSEMLKVVRKAFLMNGIDDSILRSVTKAYEISRRFLNNTYSQYMDRFEEAAQQSGLRMKGNALLEHMLSHIEDDSAVLEVINKVYYDVNGDVINWDRGISAGDILSLVQEQLCGTGKPYNKILILFDEFGRFIEYAAANPLVAGEAALQQVFEAVQSANGKIIFIGFIQNDLSAYLSRIERTANIIRYVGRYETSEKLYLSSNFETILANLLVKKERDTFSKKIGLALDRYERFHSRIQEALKRWDRSNVKKGVWTSPDLYKSVILEGCYPLHPITVWLLSNTSSWMQQRSTITFAAEMFESIKRETIEGTWLPYVYPIDIVDSSIYNEMLNSEEKGLVQSQYCMLYRDILLRVGSKLNDNELRILKAILVVNIARFSFRDKDDAIQAIRYCSNLKEEDVLPGLKSLEDMHGVIAFDENARSFDLIAEANGFNEFKLTFARRRVGVTATISDCDEDILNELQLTGCVETSFAQAHDISSSEWCFERRLIESSHITTEYISSLLRQIQNANTGEAPRGYILYAYCNTESSSEVTRIASILREKNADKEAIIILFLDDAAQEVTDALKVKKTFDRFTSSENERFQKHIIAQKKSQTKKVIQVLSSLIRQRRMIGSSGLLTYEGRINALCSNRFEQIFTSPPPFAFDGFQNKVTTQAKKSHSNICVKLFDRTLMNVQSYQALTQDEKNRVRASMAMGIKTSWQIFDSNCTLDKPKNTIISRIYDEVLSALSDVEPRSIMSVMNKYTQPPFGMNMNAVALFIFYFIAERGNAVFSYYGQEKLTASVVSDKVFKGGKLQINEFFKIRLQLNASPEIDAVADLCRRILKSSKISEFQKLKESLDSVLAQEGSTPENQSIIAQANVRLDEGIRIRRAIEEKLVKATEIIDASNQSFVIYKFVKVLDFLPNVTTAISEEYNFEYDDALCKRIEQIKKQFDAKIAREFSDALKRVKCKITQLSQVKGLYNKAAETLGAYGYQEQAEAIRERISVLESELIARQKYESSLVELEKDIALASNCDAYGYTALNDMKAKISAWMQFIRNAKELPSAVAEEKTKQLENVERLITVRIEKLLSEYRSMLARFNEAKTFEEMDDAHRDILAASKMGYDSSMLEQLDECDDTYRIISNAVNTLSENLDELRAMIDKHGVVLHRVLKTEIRSRISLSERKQSEWIAKYITPAENDIRTMSASVCTTWLERTKVLPAFLDSQTLDKYASVHAMIEERLHYCRVDGVVSMFMQLSKSEQEACLKELQKIR